MAASNAQVLFDITNSSAFQLVIQSIVGGLTNAGWVQSADTGQLNPTTVARPAVNTLAGYLMYRMNDPLQATAPVFLKLRPGTAATANTFRVLVSVGTTTDGAGSFTGTAHSIERALATFLTNGDTTAQATDYVFYSGNTSRFTASLKNSLVDGSHSAVQLTVERSRDGTGAETADGFVLVTYSESSLDSHSNGVSYCRFGVGATEIDGTTSIDVGNLSRSAIGSSGTVDNFVYSPVFPVADQFVNPVMGLLFNINIAQTLTPAPVSVTHYGAARTFQGVPGGLMLYE